MKPAKQLRIISICALFFVLCNSCHRDKCNKPIGNFLYRIGAEDIYYFKITNDSIYSLLLPKQYATGHLYKHLSCDAIEVFDMMYVANDSFKYPVTIKKFKYFSNDSLWIIDLQLLKYFDVRRATPSEVNKYDTLVYKLLVSWDDIPA